ncbi:hypothetical protein AVEN_223603-1 [Araneus ventricosus]|uniref:Uncharacterized protein n=1 Tax=Araneus ventricosus TaxID=182803 RepID=A0A4Y2P8K9_ARAVE|nr:hypothetical protein AVEN_223603-1 [Araneus ventricosus]
MKEILKSAKQYLNKTLKSAFPAALGTVPTTQSKSAFSRIIQWTEKPASVMDEAHCRNMTHVLLRRWTHQRHRIQKRYFLVRELMVPNQEFPPFFTTALSGWTSFSPPHPPSVVSAVVP